MPLSETMRSAEALDPQARWRRIFFLGGAATLAAVVLLVLDIAISNMLGNDLSRIPATAAGRLRQFSEDWLLGLYHHDFLNLIVQIVLLPVYWALYGVLRKVNRAWAGLALIFFIVGTTLFIAGNAALPMLGLSRKYAAAAAADQAAIVAAGEALLARGAHGSAGVLLAFFLPTFAGLLMSWAMFQEKAFGRATSILGIVGNLLLLVYLVLVTFVAGAEKFAVALAMPGGLLTMAWMALFAIRLFRLARE